MVAPNRQGFSREFLSSLSASRVRLLVPIQYFDSPFKVERSPKTVSGIEDIRSAGKSQLRVPQPFYNDGATEETGRDLFVRLRDELRGVNNDPTIRVIVGRAGIGKSILFKTLFDSMYTEFLRAKGRQQSMPRPIPLLPEHMKEAGSVRTDRLIDNFLRTDVAAPIQRETFHWLLVNGFATWMLDGLDELYAGDPNFFDYLLDLITVPGTKAQITIWCRDSLLTTSDAFSEFREMCSEDTLRVYRLAEWRRPSKRQLAWIKLRKGLPRHDENDSVEIQDALKTLDSNDTIRSLSGLPFYCDILLQQIQDQDVGNFTDEVTLLDDAIDRLVDREVHKGLFDLDSFEEGGLAEWLEEIAAEYIEENCTGVDISQAEEYGEIVLRRNLSEGVKTHIVTSLLQFPLFQAGKETGRVMFAHDLMAEALAARAYVRILQSSSERIGGRLSSVDLEDPTLLRFIANRLDDAAEDGLVEELTQATTEGLPVVFTLLLLARPERDLVLSHRIGLEDRNLVGVRFSGRDLSGVSFRRSDLSYVTFHDCDLTGARFGGAFFNRTKFSGKIKLRGAEVGNLAGPASIMVGTRVETNLNRILEWFGGKTGQQRLMPATCPTALQMAQLFGKFVTPLGEPRRKSLSARGIVAGRRYDGAAKIEECVREAVRSGYLLGPDRLKRFERTEGDTYAEVVSFVRDRQISNGIGQAIANLCSIERCLHQF